MRLLVATRNRGKIRELRRLFAGIEGLELVGLDAFAGAPEVVEDRDTFAGNAEKKAREMWFLCKRYSAREALEMGLVNHVVPDDQLDAEVDAWCAELVQRSPTAIAIAKRSFNADTESIRGIGGMGFVGLSLYYGTDESKEGVAALQEKRDPDFRRFA